MKHVDEYRDAAIAKALLEKIHQTVTRPIRLMEICGTHTMAIFRHGIRSLLSDKVELLSGPGCPVCVTAMEEVDRAIKLAGYPEVILTTFGDMLRVPGSSSSLDREKAEGADVRMVYSTFDAIHTAEQCPDKEVVFLGSVLKPPRPPWPQPLQPPSKGGFPISRSSPPTSFFRRPCTHSSARGRSPLTASSARAT
jgi:hydrogenase expression/formation protein HypD